VHAANAIVIVPTTPEELASPSGKSVDLEFSSSRADSQALAATIKARAEICFSAFVALSM
jgi:hypothetical protein